MSVAPWEFVDNVLNGDESLLGYNTFLTNRVLSSNPKLYAIRAFDCINSYEWSSVPEEIRAKITAGLIKAVPRYRYKYVKNAKVVKLWKDEDVKVVMQRVHCSELEAKLYIEEKLITQDTLEQWKSEGYYE